MELRRATSDDLDAMTEIMVSAFPMDPQWNYRFPLRHQYPEDHRRCTREWLSGFFQNDHLMVNVLLVPESEGQKGGPCKVVALAVWELQCKDIRQSTLPEGYDDRRDSNPEHMKSKEGCDDQRDSNLEHMKSKEGCDNQRDSDPEHNGTTEGCDDRRDSNPEHMKAFEVALTEAKQKYFDSKYGDGQVHLFLLGTHPHYQRRGLGRKHCQWGMELAEKHKVPVTVFSSPMGGELYSKLGFATLGQVIVQVKGEKDRITIGVMIHENDQKDNNECVGMVPEYKF